MIQAFQRNEYFPCQNTLHSKILNNDSIIKRLRIEKELKVHQGCVNSIVWNHSGEYILSGSDDLKIVITNPFSGRVAARVPSGHRRNIFQAKFLPNSGNRRIVSCSVDGSLAYTQLGYPELYGKCLFKCHSKTAYQVQTTPGDPNTFLSASEDGTIRCFDTREQESCLDGNCRKNILLDCKSAVTSLDVDPIRSYYVAAGTSDSVVRIFDRRMMKAECSDVDETTVRKYLIPSSSKSTSAPVRKKPITCLKYDSYGACLLTNTVPKTILELDCWSDNIESIMEPDEISDDEDMKDVDELLTPSVEPRNPRVRLGGDWSDTGPSAVPHSESNTDREMSRTERLFSNMSSALTNILRTRSEDVNRASDDDDITSSDTETPEENTDDDSKDPPDTTKEEPAKMECPNMHKTKVYMGHRNQRTAIKQCAYWGDNLVVAGSDCGHVFLWRRDNGKLINLMLGDKRVVNCVQPHPYFPILATSGIDYDIKIWTPSAPDVNAAERATEMEGVLLRNRKMLEAADEVVTLPARFILPLLGLLARRQDRGEDAAEGAAAAE